MPQSQLNNQHSVRAYRSLCAFFNVKQIYDRNQKQTAHAKLQFLSKEAFLENLNHALENIWLTQSRYTIHKEVAISHVFDGNESYNDLFYNGRFDFVVYEKIGKQENAILAIELDGKEHFDNAAVINRDKKKNAICKEHNLQLIRVENSYARRYNHIKEILINFFSIAH